MHSGGSHFTQDVFAPLGKDGRHLGRRPIKVTGRGASVLLPSQSCFKHHDTITRVAQSPCRQQTGDAGADNDHVGSDIAEQNP
ncbi:hypothetical protein D3C71_1977380 [compost metagenome]